MARILVADDDPDVQTFLSTALAAEGHDVSTAGDAPSAIEAVKASPFDLVVLDMGLPGLDVDAPAQAVRSAAEPAPKVLILTGRDLRRESTRGTLKGADASLEKGCSVDRLIATVEKLVKKQAAP